MIDRYLFYLFRKLGFVLAWIFLIFFAYRVSLIETEHKDYDPFAVLNVDPVNISSILILLINCVYFVGSNDQSNQTCLS
jgi:hypothetical protein